MSLNNFKRARIASSPLGLLYDYFVRYARSTELPICLAKAL